MRKRLPGCKHDAHYSRRRSVHCDSSQRLSNPPSTEHRSKQLIIERGNEEAHNAMKAPGKPRTCRPKAVQYARKFVPGVTRASANENVASWGLMSSLYFYQFAVQDSNCWCSAPKRKIAVSHPNFARETRL
jgi:hypothetical protein